MIIEEIINGIMQSINIVQLIGYAITIGVWELTKMSVKKLAHVNPVVYMKIVILLTGIAFVSFAADFADLLHIALWQIYALGGFLTFIIVLPYALKMRGDD